MASVGRADFGRCRRETSMNFVQLKPGIEIEYPESDGEPMGETELHRQWMIYIYEVLKQRYRTEQVYIGSDLLLYYVEGDPGRYVVPDDFVVLDCDPGPRRTYKLWEELRVPNVVFEVTSKSTRHHDTVAKRKTYAEIGVAEYFLYDPTSDYLSPELQGYRLIDGSYEKIEAEPIAGLECRELGVTLRINGKRLEFVESATGQLLYTREEAAERLAEAALRRAEAAAQRIEAAEQQVEAAAQQIEAAAQQIEAAAKQAAAESERAKDESRRANVAESRVEQLESEIRLLKQRLADTGSSDSKTP
jgi:Uma2 family endonuclease